MDKSIFYAYIAPMAQFCIDEAIFSDPRLAKLGDIGTLSMPDAIGLLVMFWAKTRKLLGPCITHDEAVKCLSGPEHERLCSLAWLIEAGFVLPGTGRNLVVADNADYWLIIAKRRRAGEASAAARRKPKALPEPKAAAVARLDKPAKKVRDKPDTAANVACWEAYKHAYLQRYSTEPLCNQQTRSMVALFVKRVGRDIAPNLAVWYVGHPDPFYLRNTHVFKFLLANAETLMTQFKRNQSVTHTQAQRFEQQQLSQAERIRQGLLR